MAAGPVFIDTSVFYNVLFGAECAEGSQRLLEALPRPVTSYTVVGELVFVVARKACERGLGVRSYYGFRGVIAEGGCGPVWRCIEGGAGPAGGRWRRDAGRPPRCARVARGDESVRHAAE